MRNIWDTKRGYMKGLVTAPKKLKHSGVKRLMEDALWTQGLRKKLEQGKRRHEFQADHGFRKWFKTHCQISRMDPINIEELMNHSTGISDSYYRPTELHLLEDYLKAVDLLTINEDSNILHKKVQELKEKSKDNEYIIKAKLQEKDEAIQSMKEKYDTDIALLKDAISDMQQLLKNPEKLIEISKAAASVIDR
jgi:hypothetical protein